MEGRYHSGIGSALQTRSNALRALAYIEVVDYQRRACHASACYLHVCRD